MRRLAAAGALLVLAAASPAHAQSQGNGYLFGAPNGRLSIHTGYARAGAGSDLFSQVTSDLTLNKSDFSGPTIGAELAFVLSPRLDLAFQVDYAGRSKRSEYRNLVEGPNNLPIEQTTTFQRVPLTANIRAYLSPRGRSIGTLAWIPSQVVPWVGVGGGAMWYRFRQQGDFVDFQTNRIFPDTYNSDGWAPTAQGMGGVDITLTPRIAFTMDARYTWARATLASDFSGFNKIDLSGVSTGLGFTLRL
jgi:hypothetical protein